MELQGKNYSLVITGLLQPIIPEQCSAKVSVCVSSITLMAVDRLPFAGQEWFGRHQFAEVLL